MLYSLIPYYVLYNSQVITQVCQMLIGPMSLIFCGHLGCPIQLDGAALGISVSLSPYFLSPSIYLPLSLYLSQSRSFSLTRTPQCILLYLSLSLSLSLALSLSHSFPPSLYISISQNLLTLTLSVSLSISLSLYISISVSHRHSLSLYLFLSLSPCLCAFIVALGCDNNLCHYPHSGGRRRICNI